VEAAYLGEIGRALSLELAKVSEEVSQGYSYGSITNADMRVFNLRAPLSGRIVEVNRDVVDNPELIPDDPRGNGWLLKVEPSNFENESEAL